MEERKKRNFNKKTIILIIILLLLVAGGVFWWLGREKEEVFVEEMKFEPPENYVIKDTPEGKIVENKNAGLSFRVPEGWGAEINEDYMGEGIGIVDISSPDVEINPKTNLPQKGCGAAIRVEYDDEKFQSIKNLIKNIQENPDIEDEKYELIKIDQYSGLREILFDNPKIGQSVSVRIPNNDKIYIFETILILEEKDRCKQEFDKFLETISID